MLVVSRKAKETIVVEVGNEIIEFTIAETGKQVKVAINASKDCKIWRKEIYETMNENKEAVNSCSGNTLKSVVAALKK